jgi:hypothetical protein
MNEERDGGEREGEEESEGEFVGIQTTEESKFKRNKSFLSLRSADSFSFFLVVLLNFVK